MKRLLLLGVLMLAAPAVAQASSLPLYVAAHQHSGGRVPNPQRFTAIVGYPDQCVAGVPCWTYTKGSRSANAGYPESWYLHVRGRRVKDQLFNLFVMDPRNAGWQRTVARACGKRCYIDGLGSTSLSRTTPRLSWSAAKWINAASGVVAAVRRAGKLALPNSIGHDRSGVPLVAAAGGRGSTEGFTVATARVTLRMGRIWVQERGSCVRKFNAYERYRGRGDHFACYMAGTLPWDTGWFK